MRSEYIGARDEFTGAAAGLTQAQADARYVQGVGTFNGLGDVRYVRLNPAAASQQVTLAGGAGAVELVAVNSSAGVTGSARMMASANNGFGGVTVFGTANAGFLPDGTAAAGKTLVSAASQGASSGLVLDGSLAACRVAGDFRFGTTATPRTASASTHTVQVFDQAGTIVYLLASLVQ